MGDYSEDWHPWDQRLPPTLYTELLVLESSIISACDGSQDALSVEAHARYEPSSLAACISAVGLFARWSFGLFAESEDLLHGF